MKKTLSPQEEQDLAEVIGQSLLPYPETGPRGQHPLELEYPKFSAEVRKMGELPCDVARDLARAHVHVREIERGYQPLLHELHKLYWPVETTAIAGGMKVAIEKYHYRVAADRAVKFASALAEHPANREKRRLREARALDKAMEEAERRMAREERTKRLCEEAARLKAKSERVAAEKAEAKAEKLKARTDREARRVKAEQEKRTRTMWRFIALGAEERVARLAVAACVPVSREALEAFTKTVR